MTCTSWTTEGTAARTRAARSGITAGGTSACMLALGLVALMPSMASAEPPAGASATGAAQAATEAATGAATKAVNAASSAATDTAAGIAEAASGALASVATPGGAAAAGFDCDGFPSLEPANAASTPEGFVEMTSKEVLCVLRSDAHDTDAKLVQLEVLLDYHANFETISKLVLARGWLRFDDAQKEEFAELFRGYLTATYGKNIESYSDQDAVVTGGREEARGDYTVKTKVVGSSGQDILVDYRLRKNEDRWQIIDVKAEGVSMVSNLRSQFQEVMSAKGPGGLLETLRKKQEATS